MAEHAFSANYEVAVRSLLSPVHPGRQENQDNYLIINESGHARWLHDEREVTTVIPHWSAGYIRLAVMDGVGGHQSGRQATEKTAAGLLEIPPVQHVRELGFQLEALHRRLHQEMHRGKERPGCTLTILDIPPQGPALLFHAGDSRLYEVREEGTRCLTVDHVPATKFAMWGALNGIDWQRQVHEQPANRVSQAFVLGNTFKDQQLYGSTLDAELYELHDGNLPPFLKGMGDRRTLELSDQAVYLLASDGLWCLAKPQLFICRWSEILVRDQPLDASLAELFAELAEMTRLEPGQHGDNCTAIVLRKRS